MGVVRVRKYRRDDLGRFASKKELKKSALQKPALQKPAPKKPAPKKPPPKKPPPKKPAPKKPAPKKPAPKKPAPKKPAPKKPAPKKPAPKKPAPKKPAPKKPAPQKPVPKKPAPQKPAPKKPVSQKPVPKKPVPKKPAPKKSVPKKPVPQKPAKKSRRRRRLPPIPERAVEAKVFMDSKIRDLADQVAAVETQLQLVAKSQVNVDATVDGELRLDGVPPEMRTEEGLPSLVALLSEVFRAFATFPVDPPMGGKFWASFGVRFGPQNELEMMDAEDLDRYKRFRGFIQSGTYPTPAWLRPKLQEAITLGLWTIIKGFVREHGVPPSVVLVRFIWTPGGERPGHWEGEGGGKK